MTDGRFLLGYRWQHLRTRLAEILRREGRALAAGLRDPFFLGLILLSLLLVTLAYQVDSSFSLDIGTRPEEAFLEGFHDAEKADALTFRWTTGESAIHIPGWGMAPQRLDLTLAAPRPPGESQAHLRLEAGGRTLAETSVGPAMQRYSFFLPKDVLAQGDVDLVLYSDVFTPTGDARVLGVAVDRLELRPAGAYTDTPPMPFLLVGLSVALTALLARRLGWSRWGALGAGGLLALAMAAALAWSRPLLVVGLNGFPLGIVVAWLAVILFQGAVRGLFRRAGASLGPSAERALWSVVVVFLVVRLAGVLHPALETWDLCFHWHNLQAFADQGRVLFTIISREWRSQATLYLPSLYILQAPLWGLFGGRLVPFEIVGVLLDTSSALLVAYIARRLLGRDESAPLAAFLYLTMPQSSIIFAWGIVSNILGQWLLLLVVAYIFSPAGRLSRWREWLSAVGLLVPALLAHPGAVLLIGVLLAGLLLLAWLSPVPPTFSRKVAWRWIGAVLVAVLVAVLLYYSHFAGTMWSSIQAMREGANPEQPSAGGILVVGPVIDRELGLVPVEVASPREAVLAGVRELAAEARAYYHTWPLALALAAPIGFALERRTLALRLVGIAFVIALLFGIVGLAINLYVRYMYFLLPIVALGTAWWAVQLDRYSWVGRFLVLLGGLYLGVSGLWFWIDHVLYYSAGCR
jgi:hypothetical protein